MGNNQSTQNNQPNFEQGSGGGWEWKKCVNWPNNDVNKCKEFKPGDTVGWMKCGIGSNPSAGLCSPYSDGADKFDCAWGQDCYAITKKPDAFIAASEGKPLWEKGTGKDINGTEWQWEKCINWPNNNVNKCKEFKPEGTVGWMKCGIGSNPSSVFCSPYSDGADKFDCAWGQDCYAITKKPQPNWEKGEGKDAGGRLWKWEKCVNWPGNDINKCNEFKPEGTVGWMKCGIGSNPSAGLCSPYSDGVDKFDCAWGQDCYAIMEKPEEVIWEKSSTGCDGKGRRVTLQKCNNWLNNDPKSCLRSAQNILKLNEELKALNAKQEKTTDDTDRIKYIEDYIKDKPLTIKWANCGLGSSPGGSYPGDPLTGCSPFSASVDEGFGCMFGQNCFAVTEDKEDSTCPNLFFTDPLKATGSFFTDLWEKNKIIIIAIIVIILICIILSSLSYFAPFLSSVSR